jgi:hypothetical protein
MYLNISGVFCGPSTGANHAAPGECYYYQNFDRYKIGIRLHLFTILRKQSLSNALCTRILLTRNSCWSPRGPPIHTSHPTQVQTHPPHQRLHHHSSGIDRKRRSYHDRSRSLRRNNSNAILDRRIVHLDHRRPGARLLQRQGTTDRSTPRLDAEDLVLCESGSQLIYAWCSTDLSIVLINHHPPYHHDHRRANPLRGR